MWVWAAVAAVGRERERERASERDTTGYEPLESPAKREPLQGLKLFCLKGMAGFRP